MIEQLVKVESNSTAIYRIMRTGTVAFLGEGVGFKVLERRVNRVILSDDLTAVVFLGRRRTNIILNAAKYRYLGKKKVTHGS